MSYYADLGVEQDASQGDIKRAYMRKVRSHPPESDPLGFQQIRTAYEILSDEAKRRSYDVRQAHGDRLTILEAEAVQLMEEESWSLAEARLKEIAILDPELHNARNLLALCMAHQSREAEGIDILKELLKRYPDELQYQLNLGHLLLRRAGSSSNPVDHLQALAVFEAVTHRAPYHSDAWLMQAKTLFALERHEEAWRAGEQAIGADGKEDVGDLEAFFFLVELTILTQRESSLPSLIRRIRAVTENNPEARDYCVRRCLDMAKFLLARQSFKAALPLLDAALTLNPLNKEIRSVRDAVSKMVRAIDELEVAKADPEIIPVIKVVLFVWLAEAKGEEVEKGAHEELGVALENAARTSIDDVLSSLEHVRFRYSALNTVLAERLAALHSAASERVEASSHSSPLQELMGRAAAEIEVARGDEHLIPAIRMGLPIWLSEAGGETIKQETYHWLGRMVDEAVRTSKNPLLLSLSRIKDRYPALNTVLAKRLGALYIELGKDNGSGHPSKASARKLPVPSRDQPFQLSPSQSSNQPSGNSGCLLWLFIVTAAGAAIRAGLLS